MAYSLKSKQNLHWTNALISAISPTVAVKGLCQSLSLLCFRLFKAEFQTPYIIVPGLLCKKYYLLANFVETFVSWNLFSSLSYYLHEQIIIINNIVSVSIVYHTSGYLQYIKARTQLFLPCNLQSLFWQDQGKDIFF